MEGKIADTVLTFSVEGILSKVASLAAHELSLAWGFKAQLRRLRETLTAIERLLVDVADQPQGRSKSIEEWVKNLKDIAHDADDVLDEFDYEVDRRKVEIQNHIKKKVLNFFSLSNPLAFRLKMAHKIQKINASLVDLKSDASFLGLVSKSKDATPRGNRWDRQTNSLIGRDEITVGREEVVSKIVTTLTDSKYNQENLAVMAIVGMGGLGKTTLAKSVYNNEDSIHKFFEKKFWICVSDTFDVNLILLRMLEDLKLAQGPSKDNQNAILTSLHKELKDKRYLLVLDDVWNEESGKWENLMDCLSKLYSAKGSKIIVTTRNGKVATISEKLLPRHHLGKLSADECWSIMKYRAFSNSSAHIADAFQTIGREIAKNCGGIPLVAKTATEYERRRENFFNELEVIFADVEYKLNPYESQKKIKVHANKLLADMIIILVSRKFNFVGRLLGPRGNSLKRVEASTGCRVYIRGKCSIRDIDKEESLRGRPGYEHLNDPLHIIIKGELPANTVDMRLRQAKQIIEEVLKPMIKVST